MQSLMTLLLVPFMAFLIRIQADPENAANGLFSEEAKNTMNELQKYTTNMDREIDGFNNHLKDENNVLDALKEYRNLRESVENTNCKGAELELPTDDDQDLPESFISECTDSVSASLSNELSAFQKEVQSSKEKVESIDTNLKEIAKACNSNPTACEEKKNKALADLNSVLSVEAKAKFENYVHDIVVAVKDSMKNCFNQECSKLLSDLQEYTNAINSCLSSKSE